MRKIFPLLLGLLASAVTSSASHVVGAEVRYKAEGTKYRVYVTTYHDCGGTGSTATSVTAGFLGCGISFTRTLPLLSADTMTEMFCPVAGTGCGTSLAPTVARTFSDTVTLPPCAGWKISYSEGARSVLINNVSNPASNGLYVEAMLDNAVLPNSSAKVANMPQRYAYVNSTTTTPIQATDAEGDSISYMLVAPRSASAFGGTPTNISYSSANYSASQPLGGNGTFLDIQNARLGLRGATSGYYVVVLRTSDYRNGALVGYTERDWIVANVNATNPKIPLPQAAASFNKTACPGSPTAISIAFSDSTSTDSVYIDAEASIPLAVTNASVPGLGSATAQVNFTLPSTFSATNTPYFYIRLRVRDGACTFRGAAWYDVKVNVIPCNADSVWPGDADANYVVNLYDPLAIAIAAGKTGPARAGASTAWMAQYAVNWSTAFASGLNHKHADCDGNGTVALADLAAVTANYSLTHPRGSDGAPAEKTVGVPDLRLNSTGITLKPGATVTVPITLGNPSSVIYGLYGLACRIRILNLVPPATPAITYGTTWLGTTSNTLRFSKDISSTAVDWAYSRTDGNVITGQGTLAGLQLTVPAGTPVGTKVVFRMEMARLIDKNGTQITTFNTVDDTATVVSGLSVAGLENVLSEAAVIPNPSAADAELSLTLAAAQPITVRLTNAMGQTVWIRTESLPAGAARMALPGAALTSGWYFVSVTTADGSRIVPLRWLIQR